MNKNKSKMETSKQIKILMKEKNLKRIEKKKEKNSNLDAKRLKKIYEVQREQ